MLKKCILRVKEAKPLDVNGEWSGAKLLLKVVADKDTVNRIKDSITKALLGD